MKNYLKAILLFVSLLFITSASAQIIRLQGGLNASKMLVKANKQTISEDLTLNPGYHVGATMAYPFYDLFFLEAGARLSTKGFRMVYESNSSGSDFYSEQHLNLIYLDIPANIRANFRLGSMNMYGLMGFYVGIGISGNEYNYLSYNGDVEESDEMVVWGESFTQFVWSKTDFGLMVGTGIEGEVFGLNFYYAHGLQNISGYLLSKRKYTNRVLGLGLSLKFGS